MHGIEERTDPVRIVRRLKPGGGTRAFARLTRRDALAWHALAGEVAAVLEPRLDRRVAANRTGLAGRGWRLEDVSGAAARAGRVTGVHLGLVLHTDVERFYESVTPTVLGATLRAIGLDAGHAARAAAMLEGWARSGCRGLPVGPPGSAVMANAVLVPVDRVLGLRPFVRWVDDYRIAVASHQDAALVLTRMDAALAGLGLRRSPAKTGVGPARELPFPGSSSGIAGPGP